MGLFKLKRPVGEQEKLVTSQDVVDHLTALHPSNYAKLIQIVDIYREADKQAEKISASMKPKDIVLADVKLPYLEHPSDIKVKKSAKKH